MYMYILHVLCRGSLEDFQNNVLLLCKCMIILLLLILLLIASSCLLFTEDNTNYKRVQFGTTQYLLRQRGTKQEFDGSFC